MASKLVGNPFSTKYSTTPSCPHPCVVGFWSSNPYLYLNRRVEGLDGVSDKAKGSAHPFAHMASRNTSSISTVTCRKVVNRVNSEGR